MDHERGAIGESSIVAEQGHQTLMNFAMGSMVAALMGSPAPDHTGAFVQPLALPLADFAGIQLILLRRLA